MILFIRHRFLPILLLILITSCSTTRIDTLYFDLWKELLIDSKPLSTEIGDIKYSYAKIFYKEYEAVYILSEILNNGVEIWVGADSSKILIYKGLIIKTIGLENDFEMHAFKETVLPSYPSKDFFPYVSLKNPSLEYAKTRFKIVSNNSSDTCFNNINYVRSFVNLGFSDLFYFCFDDKNIIQESIQVLEPGGDAFKVKFHYLYNHR